MKSLKNYTIVLRPDDNGTYVAYIPAISGCHAWGNTPEEATNELSNVFDMIKAEYLEAKKTLPEDVQLTVNYAS
jgi:predicted RNase H-like HicB family nuclease